MKVLVVGAGPSGLAALKEMREAGFDATAASMVLWHVIKRGVAATLGRAGRSTQVASTPRPEPARVASARPAEGTGEGEVPRIRAS